MMMVIKIPLFFCLDDDDDDNDYGDEDDGKDNDDNDDDDNDDKDSDNDGAIAGNHSTQYYDACQRLYMYLPIR
jgi:hypothetical protein